MVNKNKALRITVSVTIIITILVGFVLINDYIDQNRNNSFFPIEDSNAYAYQVEKIIIEQEEIVIKGWFFELNSIRNIAKKVNDKNVLGIVIYDINSKAETNIDGSSKPLKGKACSVKRTIRTDINDYYSCEYDYSNCGFEARLNKNDIDLDSGEYRIVFKLDENADKGIMSETYISHGKLKYINPIDEMKLEVTGTDLEEVVKDGFCLMSYPEYHICVYQYDRKLYWIADENFNFDDSGKTKIEYQIETTQFEKLPENRIEGKWFWDNIGGLFEDFEISEKLECGKYRVSVREIPNNYSVTRILTGYYSNNSWVWQRFFRPINLYK